jgi:DNA-binding GntR family transcriptional regulator
MDHTRNITRTVTTRAEGSTRALRTSIVTLALAPGTRLVERELVVRLGVSRTGVRAALQSLESEGLVVRGKRGVFSVATISVEEARQIYEVRSALEPAMARLFVARASVDQISLLEAAVARAQKAARDRDGSAYVEAFAAFYTALLVGSGNSVARRILETLSARVSYLRHVTTQRAAHARRLRTVAMLHGIQTALAARDAALAARRCAAFVARSAQFAQNVLADPA